jgi:hypothetical protein
MSRFRRYIDPGLPLALALGVIAALPLFTRPSLPTLTDAEMHVYRAAEIELALRGGVLYPRLAPDFYFGYGYPVFNFYSPLTYHLAAYYSLTTRTDAVAGTKFVLVLTVLIGALGMYLFVRDRWGAAAGIVASAAFTYSPYIVYIDPYARGDVPESFALGIAPLMLWTFDRLRRTGAPRHLALSGLSLAASILSHPLMALVVYAFLLAFLVWETLVSPLVPQKYLGPEPRKYIPQLGLAIGLGLGLAAFYWLPAGLERGAIQLHNAAGPGYFDFHKYFVSLGELLSPSLYFDLGATEPKFRYNIGLAQWILAALGALTVVSPRLRRTDTIGFTFAGLAFIYLITQASVNVWEAIPGMAFFQFPTRFLGPAALAFAPLAGNAVRWLEEVDGRPIGLPGGGSFASAMAVGAILLTAMPLLHPPAWGYFGPVTQLRMIGVELQGRALGTTSANDFLPVAVTLVPGTNEAVLDSYKRGGPIDRVNRLTLPEGATVTLEEQRPLYDRYTVDSPTDFVFRSFTFYFPGWTACVNGQKVMIDVAQPDGFITFKVPAGESQVELSFGDTPSRQVAWALTLLALIGLGAAIWFTFAGQSEILVIAPLSWRTAFIVGVVVIAGGGLKLAADQNGWFRVESMGYEVKVAQYPYYVRLERGIQILGYDVGSLGGNELPVTVYWKTQAPQPHNFQVYVHLIGPDDKLYAQSDKLNPADFPTSRWPTDKYIRDEHELMFQSKLPPGEYRLVVGLWNAGTGERLRAATPAETFAEGVVLPVRIIIP